jgi:AcrR family transcriptional regulator
VTKSSAVPDTPQRILEAAERCMNRYGVGVSMRDIAVEAGVSRGSLYRYFGGRGALVDAVLDHAAESFLTEASDRVDRRRTLAEQVAEAIEFVGARSRRLARTAPSARLADARETPLRTLLVVRTGFMARRWLAFWLPRLDDAAERGEIRDDVDHRHAAEWVSRLLLSFTFVPELVVDTGDRSRVRRFVKEGLLEGLGT